MNHSQKTGNVDDQEVNNKENHTNIKEEIHHRIQPDIHMVSKQEIQTYAPTFSPKQSLIEDDF